MYWLRKLVLCQMEDDDVEKHIEKMNSLYERLDSLITPSNPITADDIHATALLISLPSDWLPSISHLLNQPRTTSTQIVSCLKNEATRRSSSAEHIDHVIASRAHSHFARRPSPSTPNSIPHRTAFNPDAQCRSVFPRVTTSVIAEQPIRFLMNTNGPP